MKRVLGLVLAGLVGAGALFSGVGVAGVAHKEIVYANDINIDENTFPDVNFRSYVSNKIDSNNDGKLSNEEIKAVKEINCTKKNIQSLKGVELFYELRTLICRKNNLTSLDISNNLLLEDLLVNDNNLTSIDISNNLRLELLNVDSNKLNSLDVSKNTALTNLNCHNNNLSSLNVSNNTALTGLMCQYNNLSSLDVSNNTALTLLFCDHNNISSLNLDNNILLDRICLDYKCAEIMTLRNKENLYFCDVYDVEPYKDTIYRDGRYIEYNIINNDKWLPVAQFSLSGAEEVYMNMILNPFSETVQINLHSGAQINLHIKGMDKTNNEETNNEETNNEYDSDVNINKILFRYSSGKERDYSDTCYYTNSYFDNTNLTGEGEYVRFDNQLATASLCLAMSAFSSNENKTQSYINAKNLLVGDDLDNSISSMGFDSFGQTGYTDDKTQNSIAAVVADKKVNLEGKNYTLIALAVRGGGYEGEWAGNFTMGKSGAHDNFDNSKNKILSFLKEYISNRGINGDIKIWITGFSRGAAVANLIAGSLDDNPGQLPNVSLKKENLYAYTFETPKGALSSNLKAKNNYYNIFNILNVNDFVPRLAMEEFGFTRYGVDYYLPDRITSPDYKDWKGLMTLAYNSLEPISSGDLNYERIDEFKKYNFFKILFLRTNLWYSYNYSQAVFLDEFINEVTKSAGSRSNYVNNLEKNINIIFNAIYSDSESFDKNVVPFVANALIDEYPPIKVYNQLKSIITGSKNSLLDLFVGLAKDHTEFVVSVSMEFENIATAHYGETCFAWLKSLDSNYFPNTKHYSSGISGHYRKELINCPVDVEVYDSNNNLVATIIDNKANENLETDISVAVNEDEEKVIILPATETYTLKITATGEGTMDYSVNEGNTSVADITRIDNFQDVSIKAGDVFYASVPEYIEEELTTETEGSERIYTLSTEEGSDIPADEVLKAEKAKNADYMIGVVSENEEYGIVIGEGLRTKGNFAEVEAIANEGYKFIGWYENDEKVSDEVFYRFGVEGERNLVAKFEKEEQKKPVNASNYATIVTTESGTAPVLPATATVEYDNVETAENVPIEWEEVKPEQYSDLFGGEFEVKGMVEGLDVTCLVKVNQASITEITQPKDEVIDRYIDVYTSHFRTMVDYTEDLTITWGNGAKTTETAVFEGGVDDGENFVAPEYASRQTEDKYNTENKEKLDAVRKKVTVVTHSIKDVTFIPPSKTTYSVGEESDNKGAKFIVTYDDGTTREYSNEENDPDDPDRVRINFMILPIEPGTHTLTATLVGTGYTGTYEVTILKDKKHFEITKVPTKTTYYVDEEIDLEGSLYFAGSTFTGTQGTITKEMIGDYNRTEGVQKIPVYYTFDDGDRIEAFFEVLYIAKEEPIEDPTEELTEDPNEEPTEEPTEDPNEEPTKDPNEEPTEEPTDPNKEQTKPTEEQKQPTESSSDSNGKQKDSGEANNKQSNVTKVQPSQSNITQGTAVQQGVVQKSTSGVVAQASKTGDTNLTALWITLSAVSAGIVTAMVVAIKKRRAE